MFLFTSLLFSTMGKRKLYIDTDVGLGTPNAEIDDSVALIVLLNSDEIEVIGIGSIFGNVSVFDAHLNLSRLLHLLKIDHIPLGLGAEHPLTGDLDWFTEWKEKYGKTPPWHYPTPKQSSTGLLIDKVKNTSEKITILSLGPMTNIAKALQQDHEIISGIEEIIAMGGSFSEESSPPEFNIRCDPVAADFVLRSGIKTTMIGLNVSGQVEFGRNEFTKLSDSNQAHLLLKQQSKGWIDRVEEMGWHVNGCALHDAVAALYLLKRELFKTLYASIEISIDADHWGTTTISKFGGLSNHQIVTHVKKKECHDQIWSSLLQLQENVNG